MKKLRVLQVTAGLDEGGVERGTLEMAEYTLSNGGQSFVASSGGRLVEPLQKLGAHHFQLPLDKRNPLSILYSAVCLISIIINNNVNLVHARSRAPAWAALMACRCTGTPFITTFHGTHKIQNSFKKFYNSSMVRGERVIAISNFIKNHIIDNYGIDHDLIDLAPRGFDPSIFNPESIAFDDKSKLRSSLNISSEDFVISLPGRLTRWKGQVEFLQGLSLIKDIPNWKALLIGGAGKKEGYKNELQRLCAEHGLSDRIIMVGSQSNVQLYYAISDLVVSASLEPEAFGRVAVEAQAMRKPVIATAHGGSLETVLDGETGWLVPPGNVEALACIIREILSDKYDLVEIGARGREWVMKKFTTNQTCQAEWNSYQKVVR